MCAPRIASVTPGLPPDQARIGLFSDARMSRSLVLADRTGPMRSGMLVWKTATKRVMPSTFSSKTRSASARFHWGGAPTALSILTASAARDVIVWSAGSPVSAASPSHSGPGLWNANPVGGASSDPGILRAGSVGGGGTVDVVVLVLVVVVTSVVVVVGREVVGASVVDVVAGIVSATVEATEVVEAVVAEASAPPPSHACSSNPAAASNAPPISPACRSAIEPILGGRPARRLTPPAVSDTALIRGSYDSRPMRNRPRAGRLVDVISRQ